MQMGLGRMPVASGGAGARSRDVRFSFHAKASVSSGAQEMSARTILESRARTPSWASVRECPLSPTVVSAPIA
jgi:hypothetical protein